MLIYGIFVISDAQETSVFKTSKQPKKSAAEEDNQKIQNFLKKIQNCQMAIATISTHPKYEILSTARYIENRTKKQKSQTTQAKPEQQWNGKRKQPKQPKQGKAS